MTLLQFKKYRLPDASGVYIFRNRSILYIGKAASLRDRVRSYFSSDVETTRSSAIAGMVENATSLSWKKTNSVLEALILEAHLIKKHQPPFNVDEKDNKSWNYVGITKDSFPRVLLVRGRELSVGAKKSIYAKVFGPFTESAQLKEALKIIRKIFPYADKCAPPASGVGTPCFSRQIHRCPGVCTGEITKAEYAKIIRNIVDMFSGNGKGVRRRLVREMKDAVRAEDFERAEVARKQIVSLKHIRDVALLQENVRVLGGARGVFRVEAYDVAHTSGVDVVGALAVVVGGKQKKSEYRKFKVTTASNDDTQSLFEIVTRRIRHHTWPFPSLVVVDGGKAQMRVASKAFLKANLTVPIVGVVKNASHKPKKIFGDQDIIQKHERDILLANSEAHRFAISFHRARRGRFVR